MAGIHDYTFTTLPTTARRSSALYNSGYLYQYNVSTSPSLFHISHVQRKCSVGVDATLPAGLGLRRDCECMVW